MVLTWGSLITSKFVHKFELINIFELTFFKFHITQKAFYAYNCIVCLHCIFLVPKVEY